MIQLAPTVTLKPPPGGGLALAVLSATGLSILRKLGFIFKWRGRERVEDVALEHPDELAQSRARRPATGYAVAAMTPLRANGRAQR